MQHSHKLFQCVYAVVIQVVVPLVTKGFPVAVWLACVGITLHVLLPVGCLLWCSCHLCWAKDLRKLPSLIFLMLPKISEKYLENSSSPPFW